MAFDVVGISVAVVVFAAPVVAAVAVAIDVVAAVAVIFVVNVSVVAVFVVAVVDVCVVAVLCALVVYFAFQPSYVYRTIDRTSISSAFCQPLPSTENHLA